MQPNITGTNYFSGFYEFDLSKFLFVILQFVLTPMGGCLYYAIVWYEKYSTGFRQRSLLNQLSSAFLVIGFPTYVLLQLLTTVRFLLKS